jgi:cytochrome c
MRFKLNFGFVFLLCIQVQVYAVEPDPLGKFGLGRSVDAVEIKAWDIDVRPDGKGLPVGSGNVQSGAKIYAKRCAACHGQNGEGGPFDALVGRIPDDAFPFGREPGATKTIGNYWPYATTVFDYINRAMPYDAPGSLQTNEVYALVAYLLYRNQIVSSDTELSEQNFAEIIMPSRSRFVPDNRQGGPEIR